VVVAAGRGGGRHDGARPEGEGRDGEGRDGRIRCGVAQRRSLQDETRAGEGASGAGGSAAVAGGDEAAPGAGVVVANPVARAVLQGLGWLAVGLGAIGVVLPGWPTTVWLLVAAFFFARSSPRFYRWLLNHRVFGPVVRDVRSGHGLPLGTKVFAVSMITLFAGSSSIWLLTRSWIGGLVAAVGLIGIVWVLRQPTKRDGA
jgi:hypothetical protein